MEQDQSKAVRNSLEHLIAAFERAAGRNPPLYCEFLDALLLDSDSDLTTDEWGAFIEANRVSVGQWEWWEEPHEGPSCLRLVGDPKGFDEYQRLATSVCQVAGQFDEFYEDGDWQKWTYLLRLPARDFPTPLLSIRERLWGFEGFPKEVEQTANEWKQSQGGINYPTHLLVQQVAQDVFTSSAAALRIMLDPDGSLQMEYPNAEPEDWSPFAVLVRAEKKPATTADDEKATVNELFIFLCKGTHWQLRFTDQGKTEEGIVQHIRGLAYYRAILASGYKGIHAVEIVGSRNSIALSTDAKPDKEYTQKDLKNLEEQLEQRRLKKSALESAGGNPSDIAEVDEDIAQIKKYLRVDKKGRPGRRRNLGSTPEGKAFETVRKALSRTTSYLEQRGLTLMASHLRGNVSSHNKTFYYKTSDFIDWSY